MKYKTVIALSVTLLVWASAFAGIRAALQNYSPFNLALSRFLVASFLLALLALFNGMRLPERSDLPRILFTGFYRNAIFSSRTHATNCKRVWRVNFRSVVFRRVSFNHRLSLLVLCLVANTGFKGFCFFVLSSCNRRLGWFRLVERNSFVDVFVRGLHRALRRCNGECIRKTDCL
jgi:drug/metabolite transporter (DMT)-like permease